MHSRPSQNVGVQISQQGYIVCVYRTIKRLSLMYECERRTLTLKGKDLLSLFRFDSFVFILLSLKLYLSQYQRKQKDFHVGVSYSVGNIYLIKDNQFWLIYLHVTQCWNLYSCFNFWVTFFSTYLLFCSQLSNLFLKALTVTAETSSGSICQLCFFVTEKIVCSRSLTWWSPDDLTSSLLLKMFCTSGSLGGISLSQWDCHKALFLQSIDLFHIFN